MREQLINKVLEQIKRDVLEHDLTAIEDLLSNVDENFLMAYLPENSLVPLYYTYDKEYNILKVYYIERNKPKLLYEFDVESDANISEEIDACLENNFPNNFDESTTFYYEEL